VKAKSLVFLLPVTFFTLWELQFDRVAAAKSGRGTPSARPSIGEIKTSLSRSYKRFFLVVYELGINDAA
jgi:hypothetical protein